MRVQVSASAIVLADSLVTAAHGCKKNLTISTMASVSNLQ